MKSGEKSVMIAVSFTIGYLMGGHSSDEKPKTTEETHALTPRRQMTNAIARKHSGQPYFETTDNEHQMGGAGDPLAGRLTPEDLEEAKLVEERRMSGEYILEAEHPIRHKLREVSIERVMDAARPGLVAEYGPLFAKLGLTDEDAGIMTEHLIKIKKATLNADGATEDVQIARADYINHLKGSVSPPSVTETRVDGV